MSVCNDLSAVKLSHGEGRPGHCGCWMVTLNTYIGGDWRDRCDHVDSFIRAFCIEINDGFYSCQARTAAIQQFGLLRPLTSHYAGNSQHKTWMFMVLDLVIRQQLPLMMDYLWQHNAHARHEIIGIEALKQLPPVVDDTTCDTAVKCLQAVRMPGRLSTVALSFIIEDRLHRTPEETASGVLYEFHRLCRCVLLTTDDGLPDVDSYHAWTGHAELALLDKMLTGMNAPIPEQPKDGYDKFYEQLGTEPEDDD